jgi:DNA (cytosine-5)-methyltransferase 1
LDWPIPNWADETFIRKVIGEGIPSLMVKNIMLELINKLKI